MFVCSQERTAESKQTHGKQDLDMMRVCGSGDAATQVAFQSCGRSQEAEAQPADASGDGGLCVDASSVWLRSILIF